MFSLAKVASGALLGLFRKNANTDAYHGYTYPYRPLRSVQNARLAKYSMQN